jgi:hypothetical protein
VREQQRKESREKRIGKQRLSWFINSFEVLSTMLCRGGSSSKGPKELGAADNGRKAEE